MVYLGADHAGFRLKEIIKQLLERRGIAFEDCGTHSEESTDYPDVAFTVAEHVASDSERNGPTGIIGILICGSGIGMAIAANKVRGVRAALATTDYMARQSREHDNANILVLGARVLEENLAVQIVSTFLDSAFSEEERHARRVGKIEAYEAQHIS